MNKISLWAMFVFYLIAGSMHFINPGSYISLMPSYLIWHLGLIYLSGALEIIFACMLLASSTRRIASLLIIALLIAIFPANIHMAVDYTQKHHPFYGLAILRLPLQVVLIWWAWKVGHKKNNHDSGIRIQKP